MRAACGNARLASKRSRITARPVNHQCAWRVAAARSYATRSIAAEVHLKVSEVTILACGGCKASVQCNKEQRLLLG